MYSTCIHCDRSLGRNEVIEAFPVGGRLAFDAYLDAMPFQTPAGGFLNRGLILNPTLPTTGVGALGLVDQFGRRVRAVRIRAVHV